MLRPDQPIPDCADTLSDLAREADNLGLPLVARLYDHIAALQAREADNLGLPLVARLYDHIAALQARIDAMPDDKAIAEIQCDAYWHGYKDGREAP